MRPPTALLTLLPLLTPLTLLTWMRVVTARGDPAGDLATSAAPPRGETAPAAETTSPSSAATAEPGLAGHATLSCQDELHCHCSLGNATVSVQCRYGGRNVLIRWNILPTRPSPDTRFQIDVQTTGTVTILPSFLDMKLKPIGRMPAAMFIIRDASMVDALYASGSTFTTEWHLDGVRLSSLNAEQLSPWPHPLLLTVRHSTVATLRLPPLGPGARLTLDNCSVAELTGIPSVDGQSPVPTEPTQAHVQVIVRACRLDLMRTGALSTQRGARLSASAVLFDDCRIGEMERRAIVIRQPSCRLSFNRNAVLLLQREVFAVADGALRLTNNTLTVAHADALRGFCGQVSFVENRLLGPLVYGALHFDRCVQYSLQGNVFQCACGGVGWLGMFQLRQRPSVLEVFYERLYETSLCSASAGPMSMKRFARQDDCSGDGYRSTLVMVIVALVVAVALLLLVVALRLRCRKEIRKLHPPRLRRARNLYSSDISAPIAKSGRFMCDAPSSSAVCTASLTTFAAADTRPPRSQLATCENDEDDGLYATIVYKKRRAPVPPPGGLTPGPQRAATRTLNRCLSEGGIRLPDYGNFQLTSGRKLHVSGGGEPAELSGVPAAPAPAEMAQVPEENAYLIPDGSASVYMEVPAVEYTEIGAGSAREDRFEATGVVTAREGTPRAPGKASNDSGIGDDFCVESLQRADCGRSTARPRAGHDRYATAAAAAGVYSPLVRQRAPFVASPVK